MIDPIDDNSQKKLNIFGRNVAEIPCFRNSFLYGIGGGVIVGMLAFLGTSRTRLSMHIGFGSFCCGTICYWFACRYNWSKTKFEYSQIQAAMKRKALYQGTELEKEMEQLKDA